MSEETAHQRNRKRVHEIRGKLSPVTHLIWCVKSQYDDNLSDDLGGDTHTFIQKNMEKYVNQAEEYLAKVLEILDEME